MLLLSLSFKNFFAIKGKEARQKAIDKYYAKEALEKKTGTAAVTRVIPAEKKEPVSEQSTTAALTSLVDNIINPENHPDEPKQTDKEKVLPEDAPTDDEESEEDEDEEEETPEKADDAPKTGESSQNAESLVLNVFSEESKVVETIPPPNSLKREEMGSFIEDQKAQLNFSYLCGCL